LLPEGLPPVMVQYCKFIELTIDCIMTLPGCQGVVDTNFSLSFVMLNEEQAEHPVLGNTNEILRRFAPQNDSTVVVLAGKGRGVVESAADWQTCDFGVQ
jgi:hypothetical protein